MRTFRLEQWSHPGLALVIGLALSAALWGCSGGTGSGSDAKDTQEVFNTRYSNLYLEVPPIYVEGNAIIREGSEVAEVRSFNPRAPTTAELYDADGDNIPETRINDFSSFANAANRLLDFDLAACIKASGSNTKHLGYENSTVWTAEDFFPDTMPPTADETGTDGTQFIQLRLPFAIQGGSIFVTESTMIDGFEFFTESQRKRLDYLNPYFLTFSNEDWDESLRTLEEIGLDFDAIDANVYWTEGQKNSLKQGIYNAWRNDIKELMDAHVPCTVLVDGVDVNGDGPGQNENFSSQYPKYIWNELSGVNITSGMNAGSIVFIAHEFTGQLNIRSKKAFSLWDTHDEIRIHLKKIRNSLNDIVNVDSKWFVLEEGANPVPPTVVKIEATEPVLDSSGQIILDWDDPTQTTPDDPETVADEGDAKTVPLVHRSSNFLIHFSKPVIPETVGQSIVFKGAPFNGNTAPVASSYVTTFPSPNPCASNGIYRDPTAPNVSIRSTLYYKDGSSSLVWGVVPFRVYPLHQNNLCTYILNPVIDLPGSYDLGSPPLGDDQGKYNRMRINVQVHLHDLNILTGMRLNIPLGNIIGIPVNMGVTGFFGLSHEVMETAANTAQAFTVAAGGRYVNAPVSPHALYYTMGNKGLGVIDLDGNGFTTNDPDIDRAALVTSQNHYSKYGNAGQGNGNNQAFGARATSAIAPDGSIIRFHIGLGNETPFPGVNECSTGIDELVKDSNGSVQLFPDPTGDEKFYNITDVEVGDFLDTVYFDAGNPWANKSLHLSAINQVAQGAWANNLISTPPTPNPPPLTVPLGMRPTHVILDNYDIIEEGAFVIMGKEVFTVDLFSQLLIATPPNTYLGFIKADHTGFIHLNPAELAGTPADKTFPPNPDTWLTVNVDFMNLGPVAESSTIGLGFNYGSRQQIGNFLFVADKANNEVQVLNSNTMDIITSLDGLSAPDSVAVTPDLKNLYVSNSGGQSVSIYNADPRTDDFLSLITDVWVGKQPKGICCQPENEAVFICNYGSNTISIINPKTNSVRKTLSSLLNRPWDIVVGPRQINFGFGTQVFHGFISNYGGNNVLIYESGPAGYGGVGYDDILDPVPTVGENGQVFLPIQAPRGICWDPSAGGQYTLTGGCYVGHRSGGYGVVSRIVFTSQQGTYGPIFLIPNSGAIGGTPGFGKRQFLITAQWGGPKSPLSGSAVSDIALLDYNRHSWENDSWQASANLNLYVTNLGDLWGPQTFLPMNNKSPIRIVTGSYVQTFNPDQMYVSYMNDPVIDVLDLNSSQILKTITGL
ncbi:MAG: YncE family protein, partial [Planctomycetes bacterium]|nr:YncE family protein [Planctomycetota bacterium]